MIDLCQNFQLKLITFVLGKNSLLHLNTNITLVFWMSKNMYQQIYFDLCPNFESPFSERAENGMKEKKYIKLLKEFFVSFA